MAAARTSDTILVTGSTGKQGGATARRLLELGRPVRALVRDPLAPAATALAAAGAALAVGDFDDPDGLAPALDGVGAVFAIPPITFEPGVEAARGQALIDAVAKAGVEQVVFSTVASSSRTGQSAAAKAPIERHLHDRIRLATVLRPVRFMTNYISSGVMGIDGIVDGRHRHLFAPDDPMQVIALEDVAEFAVLAFADPRRYAGRTLELAGDQPTPVEAAAAITAATGVEVRYEQLTDEEADKLGPLVAETRRRQRAGERWHADIEALRVIHPGLRTFTDWLAQSGAAALRAHLQGGTPAAGS
ncbi:NmrA family NAD(P)-binding protein [Dactylosporangium sp. NPDC051541]|uniref:NmrA family NAD(P)-binding protein n=1 Tax=Dactylosporangium sp. NPDC051541 TaxID=3363977 RepID=UPI0037A48D0C